MTQPIKQCRRKRVSEQKLRVHDKYGETRYMMLGDADEDFGQVFNVTWSKCTLQPGDTRSQILSPSANGKLEFSLKQNRSKRVKQKRRNKHGETRCRGKFDDLH